MIAAIPAEARLLIAGRGIRAFVDGFIAILLPVYLIALGYDTLQVGVLSTATLLGSALMTLAVGRWGHRFPQRGLLLGAAVLMTTTGLAFAGLWDFVPLLAVSKGTPARAANSGTAAAREPSDAKRAPARL